AKDRSEFLPAFKLAYPAAASSRIANCTLCHNIQGGEYKLNPYARQWKEDENFQAIEGLDADGDGYSNLTEIQAATFPGDASDNPSTVVTTTTVAAPPGSGEAIYQANCAGCHGGAGGNLVGRSLTLSRISSVVTSGTTGMSGYSGSLSSGEIQLVSEYVFNVISAPTTTTTTAPGTPPPPPPNGSALYASRCSACHGANGGDLVTSTLSHSQMVSVTTSGRASMPSFSGSLTGAEIEAIITYVDSIAPPTTTTTAPGTPPPPPPNGSAVFASNCAGCHGSNGGDLVGRGLTKAQVSSTTNNGTSGMPGFSSRLSTAEVDAVSSYVASLGGAAPTTTTTAPGSPPPSGSAVFAENCAVCHGAGGGDLVGHSLTNSQLLSTTNNGQGTMPAFSSRLSTEQINAVVAYLSSLGSDSSTPPDDTGVDGSSLYAKYCSSCHGAHGAGGAGGAVAGTSLTRSQVISLTTDGRGSMPSYSGRMTADEIGAIADFILGLSGSGDAGTVSAAEGLPDTPGAHLYAELCSACHGATGEGGIGGAILGSDIDAAELVALLAAGSDGMPAYPDLTSDELDSLVDHTLLLASGAILVSDAGEDEVGDEDSLEEDEREVREESAGISFTDEDESGGGKSPFILGFLLFGMVTIAGTVGVMWLRSLRVLTE
ncbi:MAG: c-type cytochrome, partial [Acidimicrobiia bacterium]|nr:c-type cytochrome [Acidimicrobiia bacterium]